MMKMYSKLLSFLSKRQDQLPKIFTVKSSKSSHKVQCITQRLFRLNLECLSPDKTTELSNHPSTEWLGSKPSVCK